MSTGIYRAASAMDATARRLDAAAHNIANVSTPAFKRRTTTFHAEPAARQGTSERIVTSRVATDLSQGALMPTGEPLDLALEGHGFFAVETQTGEAYTRDGSFRVDEGGVLVDHEGRPVAWESVSGRLDPVGETITVDVEGNVRQGAFPVGRLRLVAFADEAALQLDGAGLWRRPAGLEEVPHAARVHQGALEGSNVNAIEELVALVQIQRTYESAASALSAIEQSYRRLNRG